MNVGIIGCGAIANLITSSIVPEDNGIDIALANKETCSDTVNKNNFNNLDLFKQKYFIVDIILYYSHFLLIKVEINNEN